jgi:hypothetical protein
VTVVSEDGQSASASISYLVVPNSAQIMRMLRDVIKPRGKQAKIAALLRHGYQLTLAVQSPGRLALRWYYLAPGAHLDTAKDRHKPKPVLVAIGTAEFSQGETVGSIKLKLTGAGIWLLKHSKRLQLTAQGTFTPTGQQKLVVSQRFTLRR